MARWLARVVPAAMLVGMMSCAANGSPPEPDPVETVEIPDTPVGEQINWLLDQLAADEGPEPAEIEARFADAFLAEVGPEEFVDGALGELRPLRPWTATGVTGDPHQAEVTLRTGEGDPWLMTIVLDGDERIETLLFAPEPAADRPPAQSFDALTDELSDLAEHAGFLAARVDGNVCAPVAELAPEASLPLGSTFKLYVLGALADAVAAGTMSWEDTVTVTDELRSLPSGELQDAPAGTEVTVQEAAEGMIAISDNTATDLLINRLGRDRVEAAVAAMGHADASRNIPFLTTREAFQLGWSEPDLRQQWSVGDRDARTALLADLASAPLAVTPADVTTPAWPDHVDWFASPHDLCAAHLALQGQAAEVTSVREVLSANPGIGIDSATWPYVAYKGGSAPGVVTGSWYAEHVDGTAVVVAFQLASSTAIDLRLAFAVAADAFPLLAAELG